MLLVAFLQVVQKYRVRFSIRWINNHLFVTLDGQEKNVWQIGLGKNYRAHQLIREAKSGVKVTCDLCWTAVRHPHDAGVLYLVRARIQGKVSYLMTNEPVQTEEQAWEIFFSSKRRWQIETSFRSAKCELAMERPRVWFDEDRLNLFAIGLVVYAFLLHVLGENHQELLQTILRLKCHRTGKR
jgi:hypothetical protein